MQHFRHMAFAFAFAILATPLAAQQQSPIDITPEATRYAALPALQYNYSDDVALTWLNNGSPDDEKTVRANLDPGNSLTISGNSYNLLQFHFHINCEHLLDGVVSPMEMHFVHQDVNGNYAVVGRFIEVGAENALLAPLFADLPASGDSRNIASFNLAGLLPTDLSSFRYTGSLTTPGFDEGVMWTILAEPLFMSAAQIASFGELFPDGNFRDVQPLNGRIIRTDVVGFAVPEPASWAMMIAGFGLVGAVLRRRAVKGEFA